MGLVYCIENNINGKCYIGKTINNLEKRIKRHNSDTRINRFPRNVFHKAIRKYGWKNFSYFAWYVDDSIIDDFEIAKIKEENSMAPNGYNVAVGGFGGFTGYPSKETRKKMSESAKIKLFTKEHLNNLAKAQTGRKHSKETLKKMSGKNNSQAKAIYLIHPCGTEERFECMKDACRKYNLNDAHLTGVAKGYYGRNHHKGYKCRYA